MAFQADLAEHFIESWTYTACMDVVQKCDEWSRIDRPNGDYSGLIAYESARSELLDIARVQVGHRLLRTGSTAHQDFAGRTDWRRMRSSARCISLLPDHNHCDHLRRRAVRILRQWVERQRRRALGWNRRSAVDVESAACRGFGGCPSLPEPVPKLDEEGHHGVRSLREGKCEHPTQG